MNDRREIWQGLLRARLSCMYYAEVRQELSRRLTVISVISGLSALSSIATVIGDWSVASSLLVIVAATGTVYAQTSKLPDRIGKAASLVETWARLEVDWLEAWHHVEKTGVAPDNLGDLRRSVIPPVKDESEFPRDVKRLERLHVVVEQSFGLQ